ncbi:unnamed protein product, partial [Ectocarpus fasciculatus]
PGSRYQQQPIKGKSTGPGEGRWKRARGEHLFLSARSSPSTPATPTKTTTNSRDASYDWCPAVLLNQLASPSVVRWVVSGDHITIK